MTPRALRTAFALLLEVAALALLVLVAAGHPWPSGRDVAAVYALADRSSSVPPREMAQALEALARSVPNVDPPAALHLIDFAGRPGSPRRVQTVAEAARAPDTAALATHATNIADAVRQATTNTAIPRPAAIVVFSDGRSTAGDVDQALADAAVAGIPVLWHTVAADASTPRIEEVLVPARARIGQPIPVQVRLAGRSDRPLRVTVATRADSGGPASIAVGAGALGTVTVQLTARASGPMLLDADLTDAGSSSSLDEHRHAAVVDVQAPSRVLYVTDDASALAHSLRAGGWEITSVPSQRLDALAGTVDRFDAVVVDDVPASAARPSTWAALDAAVRERGLGLLVLGGRRSFAAGAYVQSPLETLLPVRSRPAALGDAAAWAFVVDKSGSMGASAAGIDRFRLAQRAVVETAATLADRDSAALVVFDVTARTLVPLQPAPGFRQAVASPWAAQPRGGTRASPAIEMAVAQLEKAAVGRRNLVLVTDGFLDAAAIDRLRARMTRARVELIALAVGPDADTGALAGLVEPGHGTILHVGEAAELPALMRRSVDQRRAPVERGRIGVRLSHALPFLSVGNGAWPSIAAYPVTSPADGAVVHLESERGDPLIAYRQQGLGRVAVVTCGLGPWTQDWLRWRHWPALAGGLVDWVASTDAVPGIQLIASDAPSGLRIDVDAASNGLWSRQPPSMLRVQDPSGRIVDAPLEAAGPGRASATLRDPLPGLYSFAVATPAGAQRLTYLRQPLRESAGVGPSPQIGAWKRTGLVRDLTAANLVAAVRAAPATAAGPGRALLLAFALFLLGVVVDRLPLPRAGTGSHRKFIIPSRYGRSTTRKL
jgi:Ca-activated chloride channel homolog